MEVLSDLKTLERHRTITLTPGEVTDLIAAHVRKKLNIQDPTTKDEVTLVEGTASLKLTRKRNKVPTSASIQVEVGHNGDATVLIVETGMKDLREDPSAK